MVPQRQRAGRLRANVFVYADQDHSDYEMAASLAAILVTRIHFHLSKAEHQVAPVPVTSKFDTSASAAICADVYVWHTRAANNDRCGGKLVNVDGAGPTCTGCGVTRGKVR